MSDRFFVTQPITGNSAQLTGDESRHLTAVMRSKPGDEVTLFDGSGSEFSARITDISKQAVELEVTERREISRELSFDLTLAVALPKGDRQKWLVEKLTELGVTCLIPLITERGVAQPTDSATDRLRRTVIEASKQCGRNRLMEIAEPIAAKELFSSAAPGCLRLLGDPGGHSLGGLSAAATPIVITAVGPEGGFAPAELSAAQFAGWQRVSLGPRILRVETAALTLAAWAATR